MCIATGPKDCIWFFYIQIICEWDDLIVSVCSFMFDKKGGETGQMVQVISEQNFRKVVSCLN